MKPIIKWAGGKKQLVNRLTNKIPINLLNDLKDINKTNRYFEPFIGGGALLISLQPQRAYLNDINKALINIYLTCQQQAVQKCQSLIQKIQNYDININKEKYYKLRILFNKKLKNNEYDEEMAALFIFLNKHCFNGLYRVNANNEFNVPFNSSLKPSIDINNLIQVADYLKKCVTICNNDFQQVTAIVEKNDFVFIDSPYPPLNDKTFSEYNAIKFNINDHKRLAQEFIRLDKLGAYIMATNHDTLLIRSLYSNFNIEKVKVKRNVNSDGNNRTSEEIIITNF